MDLASSLFETFKGGDRLCEIISCVWCNRQNLTQLVQFDCFHLSCKQCLRNLKDPKPEAPFNCPKCDMICIVPKDGQFPMEPLQHKMHQITMILSNDKPNCTYCQQVEAQSSISKVCITCKLSFCEDDAKRHKAVPGHKLVSEEELVIEPNLSLMLKSKTGICQVHSLEQNYFCKNCQCQICPECALSTHANHKKDSVVKIATEYRKILEEKLGGIEKSKRVAEDNVAELDKKFGGIEENYRKEEETLQKRADFERSGKGTLRKKEQEAKVQTYQNVLEIEEEKNKIKQCQIAELYVKVFLEYSSDSDVIHHFPNLLSNLKNCIGEDKATFSFSEGITNVKRDVVARLKGRLSTGSSEDLDGTIKKKRQSVWKMKAKWEAGSWSGVAACEDQFLVVWGQTLKWFGMDGKEKGEIKCEDLKWGWDVEICDDEVYVSDWDLREVLVMDLNGKIKRKLSLPNEEKGIVGALGLAVDKKTKNIYVSSAITETVYKIDKGSLVGTPLITSGLDGPAYLCVVPGCHLVVSNHISNTIIKYDLEGNITWRYGYKGAEAELLSPQGVCIDPLGDIYIADSNNNRIVRVSADGSVVSTLNLNEEIIGPKAINFGKDKLVITTTTTRQVYIIKQKDPTKKSLLPWN